MTDILIRATTVRRDGSTVYREIPVTFPYMHGSVVASTLPQLGELVKRWNRQAFYYSETRAALTVYSVWTR
jgi:hypothetical protein